MDLNFSSLAASLPRTARALGIPLAAFLLTGFFIVLGFPYHHLTDRATALASRALGVEITAAESGLSPGLDGPGFRFDDLQVVTPTGDIYPVQSARFGPAWSLSWFTLTPTLFYEVESRFGTTEGRITLSETAAWRGSVEQADLDELRFLADMLPIRLTGRLSGRGEIVTETHGLDGPLSLLASDGVLAHEILPFEVPFEKLNAELMFGRASESDTELLVEIQDFAITGNLFHLAASGSVARADKATDGAVDLQVELSEVSPRIRRMIEPLGVRIDAQGQGRLHIRGTLGNPIFR